MYKEATFLYCQLVKCDQHSGVPKHSLPTKVLNIINYLSRMKLYLPSNERQKLSNILLFMRNIADVT